MRWATEHVITTEDRFEKLASNAYAAALKDAWWDKLMSVRPGKGRKQIFEWLLTTAQIFDLPRGTMIYDKLVTQTHEIVHGDRGAGLRITRNQWKDDDFQFAADWMAQMGAAMALDPQYAAIELLKNAEVNKAYDGKPFFAADHPVNPFDDSKGSYRNLVTAMPQIGGSGDPLLTKENFALAVAHMKTHKLPNGRNRNIHVTDLVVPPTLEKEALEITAAGFIEATENVLRQYRVEVLVINDLADAPKDWMLVAREGETPDLKPLIRSEREPYSMTSYDGMTQVELNRLRELEWHVEGRVGNTYGHPYQMLKMKVPGGS